MIEVVRFLQEVKLEFSKVVWPKTNDFIGSTIIVLFLVVVFALYLGLVDWVFARMMEYILKR